MTAARRPGLPASTDAEREAEVARMLAGDELTDSARKHARVLLGDS